MTSIEQGIFAGCSSLIDFTIPNSITSIGLSAFNGCSSLANITIPNSVTSIGNYAFKGCKSFTNIAIPSSVTSIGGVAFGGCISLESIEASSDNPNFKSVDGVLYSKDGQTLVAYPGSRSTIEFLPNVKTIGDGAFYGFTNLTDITIPNSVTSIGQYAFQYCSNLKNVILGSGMQSIDSYAFGSCDKLERVTCLGEIVPETNSNAFNYSHIDKATLIVPDASKEAYSSATPWKDFGTILGASEAPYFISYFVDGGAL